MKRRAFFLTVQIKSDEGPNLFIPVPLVLARLLLGVAAMVLYFLPGGGSKNKADREGQEDAQPAADIPAVRSKDKKRPWPAVSAGPPLPPIPGPGGRALEVTPRRAVRLARKALRELQRAGPFTLVEIEDGKDKVKISIR